MQRVPGSSLAVFSALCLLTGCGGSGDDSPPPSSPGTPIPPAPPPPPPPPAPGSIEYVTDVLDQLNARLRPVLACMNESAPLTALQLVTGAQAELSETAAHVDGRTFVLDPTEPEDNVYLEGTDPALPANQFRFTLYASQFVTYPWISRPFVPVGHATITRPSGADLQVRVEVGNAVLQYTGSGTVTFDPADDRTSYAEIHELRGNGNCTSDAVADFTFETRLTRTVTPFSNSFSRRHDESVSAPGIQFTLVSRNYGSSSDSDNSGSLSVVLPGHTLLLETGGPRSSVFINSISLDGDASLLQSKYCVDPPGSGYSSPCFFFKGEPFLTTTAKEAAASLRAITDWGLGLHSYALSNLVRAGVIAPRN